MTMTATTTALDVTDLGAVWVQRLGGRPACAAQSVKEFVRNSRPTGVVRVFGTHRTAPLIAMLHANGDDQLQLEVGAPPLDAERALVTTLLNRALAEPQRPRSVGGWHQLTPADIATYEICLLLDERAPEATIRAAVQRHPVWPYLQFINTINPAAVARWFALVIDPRWYATDNPERAANRLCQYLQVTPMTASVSLSDSEVLAQSVSVARYRATVSCWADWNNSPSAPLGPRDFLWRIFSAVAETKALDVAAVRATQVFVRFARAAWLDVLAGNTAGGDSLLVPEEFFKRPDELTAFREYLAGALP